MSPTLIPFFAAPWVIQLHILAAFFAIAGGGVQFFLPKGTAGHKLIGQLWVLSMAVVALSSFFIHEIRLFGLFSPIHFLSVMTLFSISWRTGSACRPDSPASKNHDL